ncbi:uncharacterized protein MELLADRAFT_69475 [Melampsora larici-populina 98AG31]|uniref:Uncharacterized protein n=1 Tax=Melampsora larici-populina (strain 98AG31 / pathotype 3-4-7) TaxID=747676 RepID=F4SAW2_MELLP|nr:uncharacterized protein MELLADRAFT_69475 [Melampsora larici-populina 98AG31]EGF98239.1 hypothetical protein MELLADRAFT_69475 [Melampsora larici-populina 98AG31]
MLSGKQKETKQPTPGPSRSQATALLEIREALNKEEFEKHAELMTAYLLRYNPEKLRILSIETEQAPVVKTSQTNKDPIPPTENTIPIPTPSMAKNPRSGKSKPTSTARNIPAGRPMSENKDDEDHRQETRKGNFVENGIEFADGKVPSHHMTQLTVFWDNRIRKFKGYVPVSMFNQAWLEANGQVEGRKSSKKKKRDNE